MIHEELLAFPRLGLHRIADLGAEWCRRYELPLPVGLNVIRRDLGRSTTESIASAIRRSLEYGLRHPKAAFAWLRKRGHVTDRTQQFVSMFANRDFACHLPADACLGLRVLLGQAAELSGTVVPAAGHCGRPQRDTGRGNGIKEITMTEAERLLALKREYLVPCVYHFYQRAAGPSARRGRVPVRLRGAGATSTVTAV